VISKYELYENSVQSPENDIEWVSSMYKEIKGKEARHLREDFCGTFQMSCKWVERHAENTAIGIDLDPEPLAYGRKNNRSRLSSNQKKRIQLLQANVLTPTLPKRDLIIVGNFSFFVFKERKSLLNYFQSCVKSLNSEGLLMLEMAGGPGMIATSRERKTVTLKGKKKFVYIWDQQYFDPITHQANYAIHFKLPNGEMLKNQFTYDWRLWTIPEVREAMEEAGFSKTHVFWETEHKGEGTGEYVRTDTGDNAFAWIAYVVGER
jgi:hypothetical protein